MAMCLIAYMRRLVGLLLVPCFTVAFAEGPVQAIQGALDLTNYLHQPEAVARLSGEWAFSWQAFDQGYSGDTVSYIPVPGNWSQHTKEGLWGAHLGYGTYSLRVTLPESGRNWALYIPPINSAYRLFVNGEQKVQVGVPDTGRHMTPALLSRTVQCFVPGNELSLVLHVSNYNFVNGGLSAPLLLGRPAAVEKSGNKMIFISSFLIGSLLIMCFYHLFLYFFQRKDPGALYFAGICFFMAVRESFAGYALFFTILGHIDHEWSLKILYSTFPLSLLCFAYYCRTLFPAYLKAFCILSVLICGAFLLAILVSANTWYGRFLPVLSLLFALQLLYVVYLLAGKNPLNRQENALIVIGITSLIVSFANDVLFDAGVIDSWFLLPAGFFIFILCQALLLALKFSTALLLSEKLNVELVKAAERKKMEEMKNRFFANMTHELRTPLTLIMAPAEKLLKETTGMETTQKPIRSIYRNASHLLNLINQLLDINKIGSGAIAATATREQVMPLLDALYESFIPLATDKGIDLVFHTQDVPSVLLMDAEKFDRILSNLLSNAIRFTPSGGRVEVSVRKGTSSLDITVSDTGIGIPRDQLPYVFNRFYQVPEHAAMFGGTGIGLSLVKELIDLLAGEITVRSTQGLGTVFHVVFPAGLTESSYQPPEKESGDDRGIHPLQAEPDLMAQANPPGNPGKAAATLLIAEDNEELLDFIVDALSAHYHIHAARNGVDAWLFVQDTLPDLVISDVMMPEVDGYELCRLIKNTSATNHIAVILLTARSDADSKIHGLSHRANDYLTKPFHLDELLLRIGNMLAHQHVLKDYFRRQLALPENQQQNEWPENPFLTTLYSVIEKNLDNPRYSVDDLASAMAVSTRTLNRKLLALTGLNANEVIRNYRLKKSIGFLTAGHTISECAYKVGFDSPSYFGKCFKEVYLETPSAYLKKTENRS